MWNLEVTDEAFAVREVPEEKKHFGSHMTDDYMITAACGTRSNATITPIIIEAAETYGWDYIDMSGLTTYENIATPYEAVLKDKFKVDSINSGVLNHPGDAGMAEIADRIWAVLNPLLTTSEE